MLRFPESLTPSQRERGKRRYAHFTIANAVTVTFLMENVLILYAIRNGMTDPQVATIASFLFMTIPLMIVGRQLVARLGAARTMALCWGLRYLLALVMVPAPFLTRTVGQWAGTAAIFTGAFGLFAFRAVGLSAGTPLVGEITTERDRGSFMSNNILRFNVMYLVSMVTVILLLEQWDRVETFQAVILGGCLLGFYGSWIVKSIPETDAPMQSACRPVRDALKRLVGSARNRRLLLAWAAGLSCITLVNPFVVIALKRGYGVSDHMALVFSLVGITGGISASFLIGIVADHVGPRPIVILHAAGFFIVCVFWAFAPPTLIHAACAVTFFVGHFCAVGVTVGIAHYYLNVVRESERMSVGLLMQMTTGGIAGLAGAVLGAGLLKILNTWFDENGLTIFRAYFRVILLILLPLFFATLRLHRLREWRIRSVLGLFVSIRDMRCLFALNRMQTSSGSAEDIQHVSRLGDLRSSLSEETLLYYLDSGILHVRSQALESLRKLTFGEKTARMLIRELERGEFTTAWLAAEILGESGTASAIPALRKSLESDDVFLRGKSMVALVQLGDTESLDRVRDIFAGSDNPRLLVHGATALSLAGLPVDSACILEKLARSSMPDPVADELLNALAHLCGVGQAFYQFLNEYNRDPQLAFPILVDAAPPSLRPAFTAALRPAANAEELQPNALRKALQALLKSADWTHAETFRHFVGSEAFTRLSARHAVCVSGIAVLNARS